MRNENRATFYILVAYTCICLIAATIASALLN